MSERTKAEGEGGREPSWARDELPSLLGAIAVALVIRTFVFQTFYVPSESMLPTLLIGDHLFVNKFVYGAKIPFTDWRLPALRAPERGDVVVFNVSRDARGGIFPVEKRPELPRDQFVKRLIGLPGDLVEVRGGELYVNEERIRREESGETFVDKDRRVLRVGREFLPGHDHAVLDEPRIAGPELRPLRLAEGQYLMMGDNRDLSNDSRIWGTIRLADMKGPAFVIYWSWDWDGPWLDLVNPVTWWHLLTDRMRWDRIGDGIQ